MASTTQDRSSGTISIILREMAEYLSSKMAPILTSTPAWRCKRGVLPCCPPAGCCSSKAELAYEAGTLRCLVVISILTLYYLKLDFSRLFFCINTHFLFPLRNVVFIYTDKLVFIFSVFVSRFSAYENFLIREYMKKNRIVFPKIENTIRHVQVLTSMADLGGKNVILTIPLCILVNNICHNKTIEKKVFLFFYYLSIHLFVICRKRYFQDKQSAKKVILKKNFF